MNGGRSKSRQEPHGKGAHERRTHYGANAILHLHLPSVQELIEAGTGFGCNGAHGQRLVSVVIAVTGVCQAYPECPK